MDVPSSSKVSYMGSWRTLLSLFHPRLIQYRGMVGTAKAVSNQQGPPFCSALHWQRSQVVYV